MAANLVIREVTQEDMDRVVALVQLLDQGQGVNRAEIRRAFPNDGHAFLTVMLTLMVDQGTLTYQARDGVQARYYSVAGGA